MLSDKSSSEESKIDHFAVGGATIRNTYNGSNFYSSQETVAKNYDSPG